MAKKAAMSDKDFFKACVENKTMSKLMAVTGLKKESINQRRTKMREAKWPIPDLVREAGETGSNISKAGPTDEDYAFIAQLRGITVEQAKEEGEKAHAQVVARGEKVKAGRAGKAAGQTTTTTSPENVATPSAPANAVATASVTVPAGVPVVPPMPAASTSV